MGTNAISIPIDAASSNGGLVAYATAREIRQQLPGIDQQYDYHRRLQAIRAWSKDAKYAAADIEAQAALAETLPEAMERGDVRAEHDGSYLLSNVLSVNGASVNRWRAVAAVPSAERARYYASCANKPNRNGLLRWHQQRQPLAPLDSIPDECRVVSSLDELAGQTFGTLYADPPWQYGNQSTRAATGNHYETLTPAQVCELPVGELAAPDAHLHLWTTNGFLREAFDVMEAWGFEYRSCFVWCKTQMGIGNYWRVSHELLLLGIRGDAKRFLVRDLKSWQEMRRGRHSEKPDKVREMIERASPGPRLELFSRIAVKGWTVFGDRVTERKRLFQ